MKKYLVVLLCSFLFFYNCKKNNQTKLRIAAAANMQFATEALSQAFQTQTGQDCEVIIGSSGKLTAQIIQGAPFDIFLSADMKYPQKLFEKDLLLKEPKVYAYGHLILWSMNEKLLASPDSLDWSKVDHVAMANPKTAPYGRAAMEVLEHYDLSEKLKSRIVYGENIAQTNQFIASGAAELGFTATSISFVPHLKKQGHWFLLDSATYQPIQQGVALLKQADHPAAVQFYDFLFSDKGKEILNTFGYTTTTGK